MRVTRFSLVLALVLAWICSSAWSSTEGIEQVLTRLRAMREKGLITDADYERTKQRLLDALINGMAAAAPKGRAAQTVVFEDDFDDNRSWAFNNDYRNPNFADYPGIKGWEHGTLSGQLHPKGRPYLNIVDGVVSGCSRGYGNDPQSFEPTTIHRGIDIDARRGLTLEFRAVSKADWPNQVTVYLLSEWKHDIKKPKYYALTIYGESSNHTIDLHSTSRDSFETCVFRLKVGRLVNAWHTYRLTHRPDGAFLLDVDGKRLSSFCPLPDAAYNTFNRIAVSTARQGSSIDWIRVLVPTAGDGEDVGSRRRALPHTGRASLNPDHRLGGVLKHDDAGWDGSFDTFAEVASKGNGLAGISWETTEIYRVPPSALNVRLHAKVEYGNWQSHASVYVYDFGAEEYKLLIGGASAGAGLHDRTVPLATDCIKEGEIRVRALLFAKHSEDAFARYYESEILYD